MYFIKTYIQQTLRAFTYNEYIYGNKVKGAFKKNNDLLTNYTETNEYVELI